MHKTFRRSVLLIELTMRVIKNHFSYFSIKTYVVSTQKSHLNACAEPEKFVRGGPTLTTPFFKLLQRFLLLLFYF